MKDIGLISEAQLKKRLVYNLIFIIGFSIALLIVVTSNIGHRKNEHERREGGATGRFPLVNPLLFCKYGEDVKDSIYTSFRFKVEHYVNKLMAEKKVNHISVYYRDLNNGPWFGINEDESFIPSSLLKLPLLISALKENEEIDYVFINKTAKFDKIESSVFQYYKPEVSLEIGKTYTIAELLRRSIVYSDNEAAILLYKVLGDNKLIKTYTDLGLVSPQGEEEFDMNVKEYSSFFRILYNASYISKEGSESALELLSTTKFDSGIRSGVPKDIIVSHKFGERIGKNNELQLHDCGIIYEPKQPYILCVMTRGNNFDELAGIIKNVSNIIYQGVTNTK